MEKTNVAFNPKIVVGLDVSKKHLDVVIHGRRSFRRFENTSEGIEMLINWLTAAPLFWSQAVLMFQKEVAQRVTATPQDKAYGRLAILTQSVAAARIAFDVPARAFSPPPKVDSAVVVLDPLPEGERFSDLKLLGEVTMAAFGQRRKMLRQSLKSTAKKYGTTPIDWCEACEIDPQRRPETLEVKAFQALAKAISKT